LVDTGGSTAGEHTRVLNRVQAAGSPVPSIATVKSLLWSPTRAMQPLLAQ